VRVNADDHRLDAVEQSSSAAKGRKKAIPAATRPGRSALRQPICNTISVEFDPKGHIRETEQIEDTLVVDPLLSFYGFASKHCNAGGRTSKRCNSKFQRQEHHRFEVSSSIGLRVRKWNPLPGSERDDIREDRPFIAIGEPSKLVKPSH
jgi:hypothetical protein